MYADLLADLSVSERVAMPYLEAMVRQGLGANNILRRYSAARSTVLSRVSRGQPELLPLYQKHMGRLRRKRGLKIIRFFKKQALHRPYVMSLNAHHRPDEERLPYGLPGMSKPYAYKFRARGALRDGTMVTRHVTVVSNELRPWGEMLPQALGYFEGVDPSGGIEVVSVVHEDIIRRPTSAPV